MSEGRLREILVELRSELARGNQGDPALRARLEALVNDIEARLARPDHREHGDTLVGNLREALVQLELEHPRATALLNRVMLALGEAGI